MDYLYSLYHALVSINVPNDKARAVIDAMERDMGTTIATKVDLQMLRQELVAMIGNLPRRLPAHCRPHGPAVTALPSFSS